MANKQPARQKCQKKVYSETEFQRALRDAAMRLEVHHMKLAIGSFVLALHRKLGLNAEQMGDVLEATNIYSHEALCFSDVQKEVKEATGLDIEAYVEGL